MVLARAGGKRHHIRRVFDDCYVLSWQYEHKYSGSRILYHRTIYRDTDRKGAERFAKKWGLRDASGSGSHEVNQPLAAT